MILDVKAKPNGKNIAAFLITHDNYELPPIKGGTYGTGGYVNLAKLFTPLNELLHYLGPDVQGRIFDEYEKIMQYLAEFQSLNDGTLDAVANSVRIIFEQMEPSRVEYFIVNQQNSVFIPTDLVDKIEEHHTTDKTYVSGDYVPLIAFGLCMQLLLPIWSQICAVVKDEVGTRKKELCCLQIIEQSNIIETEGYTRLVCYIEALTSSIKIPLGVLVNEGLSEHTLVKWALSNAIVRKLATTEFNDPETKVVNNIYSAIVGKLQNLPGAFAAFSKDKHHFTRDVSNSQDETGNDSLLEDFKRTSKIPLGYRSALQNYCRSVERLFINLIESSPERPMLLERKDALVKEATVIADYLRNTRSHSVNDYSLGVLGALFKTQFHPVALHYVDYDFGYNNLVAVAFTYLRAVGFTEPQLYLSALEEETSNRPNQRYTLSKETIERIHAAYPYEYTNHKLSQELANPGRRHINAAVLYMTNRFWAVNLPKRIAKAIGYPENEMPLVPSANFKEEYAQFILHTTEFKYDTVTMDDIRNKVY